MIKKLKYTYYGRSPLLILGVMAIYWFWRWISIVRMRFSTQNFFGDHKQQYYRDSEYRFWKLPPGSWDSHIHIVDEDRWELDENSPFHPKKATLDDLLVFEKSIGMDHVCIIAMSVYKRNNDSMIEALQRLKGKGRGIANINPETITDAELDELHKVGFRGIRLNLKTTSQSYAADRWSKVLANYADRLRRLDWVIQIYVSMDQIALVAPLIPSLRIKVVFDHLGHPANGKPPAGQVGCQELYKLLSENKDVYIKLSGTYRFEVPDLDAHIAKLMDIAPNQIVWASDWPHTGGVENNPGGDPKALQDFLTPDIPGFLNHCLDMCRGDQELIKKIWVDNPRKLWDYNEDD